MKHITSSKPFFPAYCIAGMGLCLVGVIASGTALAQIYSPPVDKTVLTELRSKVQVSTPRAQTYLDASVVARDKSVESKVVSVIRAMQESNYQYWFNSHDSKAQAGIEARNKESNRDASHWTKLWAQWMQGRKVRLVAKYDYVRVGVFYTLIRYEVEASGASNKAFRDTLVLKEQTNSWVLTHDLSEDRILTNLDQLLGSEPVIKIERILN